MTNKLPDAIKSLVIQQWLQGFSRDTIATNNHLSGGAVTNAVKEWRQALGSTTGTELRELAVTLNMVDINPAQCATGLRVATMMTKLGVKEGDFELFMSDICNTCSDKGIRPEIIASYLVDLIEFSKTVPFSKMSDYIQHKINEKEKLEQKIQELNDQKWELIGKIDELNTRHCVALEKAKIASSNLKWYLDLKEELGKNGIPVDDISQLARVVNGIRQYGFNAENVLNEFSSLELLKIQCQGYKGSIAQLKSQYDTLNRNCSLLQEMISSYNQRLSIYDELEAMGFGLKELKSLWRSIGEIAGANNIRSDVAVQKFFGDINEQYDNKLGFESKVDRLQVEVNRLNQEHNRLSAELSLFPCIGPAFLRLSQAGVKEKDIIFVAELLRTDSIITTPDERQLLINEIRKYGGLKSIIKKLTQQVGELRDEIASLETEKQDPNICNHEMFSTFVYSKQSLDVVISEDTIPREFVPLIRAARGYPIDLPEFKASVMEALKEIAVARKNQKIKNNKWAIEKKAYC